MCRFSRFAPEAREAISRARYCAWLLEEGGLLAQAETGDQEALARLRTVNRVIAQSPALLARELTGPRRGSAWPSGGTRSA